MNIISLVSKTTRIKVLLAQFSLESHYRGVITVAGILRDAGMEVLYIGSNTPEQIIEVAVQEDVDVVGISSYCGGELILGEHLMKVARERGLKALFLMGGVLTPGDVPKLKEIGFDGTFGPGAMREEIINFIKNGIRKEKG